MSDVSVQPFWGQYPQRWGPDHLQTDHAEALYRFGEYAAFVLMWRVPDFDAGLVQRCSVCYESLGLVADTFKQTSNPMCSSCYGTTFEGGIKALLIRPSLWEYTEEENAPGPRGEVVTQTASVQTTSDFRMRRGDYIFRATGDRFRVAGETTTRVRTGFEPPTGLDTALGFTYQAALEDLSSVAYIIPPLNSVLLPRLNVYPQFPATVDFTDLEQINVTGPLT